MNITNLQALQATYEISTGSGQEINVTNATALNVTGYAYGSGTATVANQKGISVYLQDTPTTSSIGLDISNNYSNTPSGDTWDIRTQKWDGQSIFNDLIIGDDGNGSDKIIKTAQTNHNIKIETSGTGDITLTPGSDTGNSSANDTESTVYADRFRHREAFYDNGNQGSTFNPDINKGNVQQATLTGNITMSSVQNIARGQSITLILVQDGTGGRTITFDNNFVKMAGGIKTLTTTANAIDVLSIFYTGSTYIGSLSNNFI